MLVGLRNLDLSHNGLTGEIPEELGSLGRHLHNLDLSHNGLTGEIPEELGSLGGLQVLILSNNGLTGEIPEELGLLVGLQRTLLQRLELSNNNLTGEIPAELGTLAKLQYLDLSGNKLTGGIPAELGLLEVLREMNVSKNPGMSGELPALLINLRLLEVLSGRRDRTLRAFGLQIPSLAVWAYGTASDGLLHRIRRKAPMTRSATRLTT